MTDDTVAAPDKVKVQITCSQTVRYAKTIEMPAAEYAKYQAAVDEYDISPRASDRMLSEFADNWIDASRDWLDADDFEDVEVQPYTED